MPSSLAHYAVAAVALRPFGFKGRDQALLALFAVAPDLDVVTAVPWLFLAPHLPVSADLLHAGQFIFGHRGLSHTLLGAVLAGAAVYWVRRDRTLALGAGVAWAAHFLLDMVSPWPVEPLAPFSAASVNVPIVTTLDWLMTLLAVAATALLLGTYLLHRIPKLRDSERVVVWLGEHGTTYGPRLAAATLAAVALSWGVLATTAVDNDARLADVYPTGLPGTVVLEDAGDVWYLHERSYPGVRPVARVVPKVALVDTTDPNPELVAHAACVLDGLGRYAPIQRPAWIVQGPSGDGPGTVNVSAFDIRRAATGDEGPHIAFTFEHGALTEVAFGPMPDGARGGDEGDEGGEGGEDGVGSDAGSDRRTGFRFRLALPRPLWEDAPCP